MRPIVTITDVPFPDFLTAESVLRGIDAELRFVPRPASEDIVTMGRTADAVMVGYAQLNAETLSRLGRCRIVARMGIGLDNVDLEAATQRGIIVTNVPDYCVDEVSDHALALLLALARKVPHGNALVHDGRWNADALVPMHRLRGQILGLIGFGKIARRLASKAQALGMEVISSDPFVPADVYTEHRVQSLSFDRVLMTADVISIHIPLSAETRSLFGPIAFAQMKPNAQLINTARGPLVDEHALAAAIASGHLSGAALDVLSQEPPAPDSPLLHLPNVILTPHTAYYSEESTAELQRKAAEDVVRVLTGELPRYPSNASTAD